MNLVTNKWIYLEYGDKTLLFKFFLPIESAMAWYLYLLECADGSYYTGITNKLQERIEAHNHGHGARYTRGRGPVKLLEMMHFPDRSAASKAEIAVKRLPRSQKRGFFARGP